jgi:hypothetical protein
MTHNIGEMERFFAELDGLLEAEVKARLAVGTWDDEKRSWDRTASQLRPIGLITRPPNRTQDAHAIRP